MAPAPFQWHARTSVEFSPGGLARLGELAKARGFRRPLLVADRGMAAAGFTARAVASLEKSGIGAVHFDGFAENPDSAMIEAGRAFAAPFRPDSVIALGGGSSLDCAKGINFVLTNGGRIGDYHGYGKAVLPMLPMIGIPTTTGTGSEAQSYALVSDAETHVKMACGAPGAAFGLVILDPELAMTQPRAVLATSGYDAISHAVETRVTTKRNFASRCFSREAWSLLAGSFEAALAGRGGIDAAAAMQMGAYLAGAAIECSMLGATHATANPLTARYGATHGAAIAVMLAHVVRWNRAAEPRLYADWTEDLAARLDELAQAASLPRTLRDLGVARDALPSLAEDASKQWTGRFNPRPFTAEAALEIYQCAY